MASRSGGESLPPDLDRPLQEAVASNAAGEYDLIKGARKTARFQSGFINGVYLFGAAAAILATIGSAGVVAPATGALIGLAAKDAGIAAAYSAAQTITGQIREQVNVLRLPIEKVRRRFGLSPKRK